MTLPTSTRVTDPYETDGVQRDFEFDFPAFYNADTGHYGIEVRRLTALDYEVIDKSLYDIFLNDEDKSGYIRFHVAPMAGDDIYIAGDTTRSQQLNLINYGRYSAQSIEKAFDLIVALIQEFVSKVDEETRQRILSDQALRDFLLIKFNQFTAEVTTKIDKHIGDINGFMSSLIPMFVCIMRKEIANYAETGMMQVINDFMDNEIEPLITEKVNSYLEQTDFAGAVNQVVAPIAEYVPLPFESQKTYEVNQRVTLSNGDIVKSTVAGNTVDPNVDMINWKPISGVLTFDMFGIDNTGTVPVDAEIRKVAELSTALKLPIHQFSGVYLLNGSGDTTFTEDTLLDGSTFKLGASFSGRFVLKRNDVESFTLTSGPAFEDLRAVGSILRGQHVLTGVSAFNYPDHWAIIETNQPLYIYRGDTKGVKFFTRLLRDNRMTNGPIFTTPLDQLSAVHLQKAADSVRLYSGFCFDETLAQNVGSYFRVEQSNAFAVRNLRYIDNNPSVRTVNQTRLTTNHCHNFLIDTIEETSVFRNASATFAYTITLSMSSEVVVRNVKSFGLQGASTGSNNCARVTYEDCLLTRIDFHEPCYDWLKIKNCKVGTMGITATMVGDMYLDDSELCMWQGGDRAFIASRSDIGGFCYGDLHINNLTLSGYNGNSSYLVEARGDGVMPAGSPISAVMFNNIYINGVYNKTAGATPTGLLACTTASTLLKCPVYIKVDGLTKFSPSVNFGSFAARSEVVRLDLLNINHSYMRFDDLNAKGTQIKAKVINANDDGKPINIVSTANAAIDIIDTTLAAYSEYNTAWNSYRPKVRIRGGSVGVGNYLNLETGVDQKNRVSMYGVDVLADEASVNNMLPRAKHFDCTFGASGWITLWSSAATVNTGSFTTSIYSGVIKLIVGYGTQKRIVDIDVWQASTYTMETGVTVVVTLSGSTATVTLNATNANLLGIAGNI